MDREGLEPMTRYAGLLGASEILMYAGDWQAARALKVEHVEFARAYPGGSHHGWGNFLPNTLAGLSLLNLHDGRLDKAQTQASEVLALRKIVGPEVGLAGAEVGLAAILYAEANTRPASNCGTRRRDDCEGYATPERDLPRYELGAAASEIGLTICPPTPGRGSLGSATKRAGVATLRYSSPTSVWRPCSRQATEMPKRHRGCSQPSTGWSGRPAMPTGAPTGSRSPRRRSDEPGGRCVQ